ncbi:hypothetical protein Scep_018981 [Stephania cephalantha]|uniref:Uncharacterized protein n=1 Tax=Stephania cephalantha TaxID=152367 RepID=A0AAP0IA74_9MAGN
MSEGARRSGGGGSGGGDGGSGTHQNSSGGFSRGSAPVQPPGGFPFSSSVPVRRGDNTILKAAAAMAEQILGSNVIVSHWFSPGVSSSPPSGGGFSSLSVLGSLPVRRPLHGHLPAAATPTETSICPSALPTTAPPSLTSLSLCVHAVTDPRHCHQTSRQQIRHPPLSARNCPRLPWSDPAAATSPQPPDPPESTAAAPTRHQIRRAAPARATRQIDTPLVVLTFSITVPVSPGANLHQPSRSSRHHPSYCPSSSSLPCLPTVPVPTLHGGSAPLPPHPLLTRSAPHPLLPPHPVNRSVPLPAHRSPPTCVTCRARHRTDPSVSPAYLHPPPPARVCRSHPQPSRRFSPLPPHPPPSGYLVRHCRRWSAVLLIVRPSRLLPVHATAVRPLSALNPSYLQAIHASCLPGAVHADTSLTPPTVRRLPRRPPPAWRRLQHWRDLALRSRDLVSISFGFVVVVWLFVCDDLEKYVQPLPPLSEHHPDTTAAAPPLPLPLLRLIPAASALLTIQPASCLYNLFDLWLCETQQSV